MERCLPAQLLVALGEFFFSRKYRGHPELLPNEKDTAIACTVIELEEAHFKALDAVLGGLLDSEKIIVRKEYTLASRVLREYEEYRRGACVIGQPGIGKTYFLVFLLASLLSTEERVIIQLSDGRPYYILFANDVEVFSINDSIPLFSGNTTWVLSDSNAWVEKPAGIFFSARQASVKVIQTASPNAKRWKEWMTQHKIELFIMDIWSADEIADFVLVQPELSSDKLRDLANHWGGIP